MFLSLLKIRMQHIMNGFINRGSTKQKKSGAGSKLLMALLMIYVIACLGFSMGMLFNLICDTFSALGLKWLYFAFAGIIAFILSFIGSVFMAKNQLYEAADNELLMSMPIKPSDILASRMAALMGMEVLYQSVVLIPALIVYFRYNGFSLSVLLMFVLGFIFLPMLVTALAGIGGYLLQIISSRFPKKNIFEMVFYILFLVVYFYFYSRLSSYMTILLEQGESIANAVKSSVFPAYCFGAAIADGSVIHIIYFILCSFVPLMLMYFVLSKGYIEIMGTKRGEKKIEYKGKRLKPASVKSALLRREMMHFFGSSMYMMNAAIGTVFLVIAAGVLIVKRDLAAEFIPIIDMLGVPVGVLASVVICFIASMNFVSAPSVSIEGNSFWLIRSLPVDAGDVLMAKAKCHFAVTMPAVFIMLIAMAVVLQIDAIGILSTLVLSTVFVLCFSMLGVIINLQFPKMNWINEVYAVKQGASSIISMLLNMVIIAAPVILYIVVFNEYLDLQIYAAIIGIIVAIGDLIMYNYLKNGGKRRFETI